MDYPGYGTIYPIAERKSIIKTNKFSNHDRYVSWFVLYNKDVTTKPQKNKEKMEVNHMENAAIREAGMAAGLKGVELRRAEVYTELGYVLDDALKLSARYCPSSHLYKLENGQFLNTAELAEHSGISKGKVRKLITAGVSATDIYNNNF